MLEAAGQLFLEEELATVRQVWLGSGRCHGHDQRRGVGKELIIQHGPSREAWVKACRCCKRLVLP